MYQIGVSCLLFLIAIPSNCYSQVFFPNTYQPCPIWRRCCYTCLNYPNYPIFPPYYPSIHNRPTLRPSIFPTRTTPGVVIVNPEITVEENVITTPTTSHQTIPSTTPCPTISTPPNRCPAVGSPSYNDCQNYKRIFPNPIACRDTSDCPKPFNTCCEDSCFGTKICKTYLKSFDE